MMLLDFVTFCNPSPVGTLSPRPACGIARPWRRLRPLLLGLAWGGWYASSTLFELASSPPRLLLNLTPSLPRGLYQLTPLTTLRPDLLVAFPLPVAVAHLAVQRGYLPPQTPLLKPLAALPGTTVCVQDTGVLIQGHWVAPVAAADTHGRPLPRWRGCVRLGPDEVFPLSLAPHSFDGRYFGPVPLGSLLGQAQPLWTWGGGEGARGGGEGARGGGEVHGEAGERGQDKGTPGEATLPKPNQALGTRQAAIFPADRLKTLWFQALAPRHPVVAGEERGHAD